MKRERKDKHFIKKPIYKGGTKAFRDFISAELRYPKEALKNKVEGVVRVRYEINHKGKVIKAKVISGIGSGCDEEAKRIVKKLKFDVPPTRKRRVSFFKTTNIHFKLKLVKKPANKLQSTLTSNGGEKTLKKGSTTVRYTITPSKPKKESKKDSGGYEYTIKY